MPSAWVFSPGCFRLPRSRLHCILHNGPALASVPCPRMGPFTTCWPWLCAGIGEPRCAVLAAGRDRLVVVSANLQADGEPGDDSSNQQWKKADGVVGWAMAAKHFLHQDACE